MCLRTGQHTALKGRALAVYKTMRNKLTVKQEKFITSYVQTGNATQSAIQAGYSPKTAQEIAAENLSKPIIIARRQELEAKINSPKIADAIERRERLSDIIRHKVESPVTAGHIIAATDKLNLMEHIYETGNVQNVNVAFVIGRGYKEESAASK